MVRRCHPPCPTQSAATHPTLCAATRQQHPPSPPPPPTRGAVLLGVVAEHGGAVEGAVVLWKVQPALEAVGALPADACRGKGEERGQEVIWGKRRVSKGADNKQAEGKRGKTATKLQALHPLPQP